VLEGSCGLQDAEVISYTVYCDPQGQFLTWELFNLVPLQDLCKAHIPFNFSSKSQILCGISQYLRQFSLATHVTLMLRKTSITKPSNGKLLYLPKEMQK